MKKHMNKIISLGVVIFVWIIFIICDAIEEYVFTDHESTITGLMLLAVPIFIPVLYLSREKKSHNSKMSKLKNRLWVLGVWSFGNIIIWRSIIELSDNGLWLIVQHEDPEEWDFNGMEYGIFGLFNSTIPLIIVLSKEILGFVCKFIRKRIQCDKTREDVIEGKENV